MEITFIPLTPEYTQELSEWHKDKELSRRYGGPEWPQRIFELMEKDKNRTCWLAMEAGNLVGYVDFEVDPKEQIASVGLVVNPTLRGIGYGKSILLAMLQAQFVEGLQEIRGGIEEDNVASIKCFQGAGFEQLNDKPDHEGCYTFTYAL